ncbi:hypothetical protein MRX96_036112 [Rhipicephalus microplus]
MVIASVSSCLRAANALHRLPVPERSGNVDGAASTSASCCLREEGRVRRPRRSGLLQATCACSSKSVRATADPDINNVVHGTFSPQGSQVSVTGSGSSGSRIEVSSVQVGPDEQGGNLTIYGETPKQYPHHHLERRHQLPNCRTEVARTLEENSRSESLSRTALRPSKVYENDRLTSRTVNGVPQPLN